MKIKFNKWMGITMVATIMLVTLNSCLKDRLAKETDFSGIQDHVVIVKGGLTNFTSSSIGFNNGDTTSVTLRVNLASVDLPSSPVNVTIGVDPTQVDKYNAANGTDYVLANSDIFSISSNTLTIPAGQQYADVTVNFYKDSVDPSVSYMLPISIIDASGKALSGNLNTIFYHIIGNPLAGNYLQDFHRYNLGGAVTDTTGPPNSTNSNGVPVVISPQSATALLLPEGYLSANFGATAGLTLSFSNTAGVLSNFAVAVDASTQATLDANSFSVKEGPILVGYKIVGDASTHYAGSWFRVYIKIQNNSGGIRATVNQFTKLP